MFMPLYTQCVYRKAYTCTLNESIYLQISDGSDCNVLSGTRSGTKYSISIYNMVPKKARATSADCSNTSKAPWQKDLTADLMGQKIRVLWPPDNIYYYGRVFRYHKKSKEHSIVYEGLNDIETIDLRTRKHEVLRNSKEEDAKQIGKVINILPPNKANIPTNHDAMIIGTEVEDDSDDPDADLDQDQDEDESETELDEDDIETEPDTEIEIGKTHYPGGSYGRLGVN